ncbi:uncharacterized protein LOC141601456 [Silene latifolia]|uniref:uncharacterized protein LOC141601456 n=1 Tax=Silene latifolia TaxID=37657 RepID=UPI003D76A975
MAILELQSPRKNKQFQCTPEHEAAFQDLKLYLSFPSLLPKPEKGEPLSVYLSVTDTAVSAVLVKEQEGQQHPVYYGRDESRAFKIRASTYSIINNTLFKRSQAGPYLRCLQPDEAKQVLQEINDGHCGNHKGGKSLA